MGTKSNFSQAFKELLGENVAVQEPDKNEGQQQAADMHEVHAAESSHELVSQPARQTTVISRGTSIVGEIKSDSNIELLGNLRGNVDTSGALKICGKVVGDAKGGSVSLYSCAMQGNISSEANVQLDRESTVIGDITAQTLTIDGKVMGNLNVKQNAVFEANAVLLGNLTAGTVSISDGARLQGEIKVASDLDTQSLFDERIVL